MAHGAAQADARPTLDIAGFAPVAGRPFLLTIAVESLPLTAGAAFEFVVTVELPNDVTYISVGRGSPTSFVCEPSGRVLTCRSRHLGGDLTSNVNLTLRAAEAGSYVFSAQVAMQDQADTDPSNDSTSRTVTVAAAPAATTCKVPNVVGKTLLAARNAIVRAGCRVGSTRTDWSPTSRKDRIVRQVPPGGRSVGRGRGIALVVGRGPRS